jgi:hypothetical protein
MSRRRQTRKEKVMRAQNLSVAIESAYRINRPLMLWGPPGIGKSSLIHQFAARANVPVLDWRLTLMEPVDMRGTPEHKNGLTYWAPPAELPTKGEGIIFLDELPQARPDTKNVAAMLTLERRIGDYRLPSGWRIMAAGNRMQDASGTTPMPQHLNNRFWHQEMELSLEDWLAWAEEHDVDFRTVAYLRYRPGALLDFDPKSKEPAFASPRSWELCSDLIKDLDKGGTMMTDMPPADRCEYFSGAVGKARGAEFSGFLQVMNELVTVDEVFANPKKATLPNDPSVCYALTIALAVAASRQTLDAMLVYMNRLPGEFRVLAQFSIEKRNPSLMKSKAYVELCAANQGSL